MAFSLAHDIDPLPHLPVELGRTGEGVGRWVPDMKHTFLAKYIEGTRYARKQFSMRVYVDLFCGPGRVQVKGESMTRHGGALIAWQHSRLGDAAFTSCLIGDLDPKRTSACAARLEAFGAPVRSFSGPAERTVDQVVEAVPKGALSLVYLDPYSLEFLTFDIVKKLGKLKFVDFAVHFSTMDLRRNVVLEYNAQRTRFDAAAPGWRDHVNPVAFARGDADEAFFEYWCGLVTDLGFTISKRMPLIRGDQNRPLYHLVFFSRNSFPNRIWDDVAQGPNREFDFG